MKIQRLAFGAILVGLLAVPSVQASTIVYNFSAPQFLLNTTTPFVNVAPNIGSPNFLASFTANTSGYRIQGSTLHPQFSGEVLRSFCFCAQTLTIQFNQGVHGVSFDFATVTAGAQLTLTSAVGSTTVTSAAFGPGFGNGGSLSFYSSTAFTSVTLGTGVFSIDNLTIDTPEPSSLLLLGIGCLALFRRRRG